jgi:hypothetical protein
VDLDVIEEPPAHEGAALSDSAFIVLHHTPVSATGEALLAPLRNGSRLRYNATVKLNLPLVGGKIESFMSGRLAEGIMDIQRFTTAWIAENC